ncbi:MAG: T9SS type A sorting domain-containing protein [Ferruginibacter sp.]|nr:T9SS type A sorting domain-containing protein [Ferruginibacter sp.]
MKTLFFTSLLMLVLYNSKAQSVIADPAVSQVFVANINNTNLNSSSIPMDNVIELKIPLYNRNHVNGLPMRSCKIKIGLGSKIVLDPQFNLSSLPSSNYFDWAFDTGSGQVQIIGDLKNELPPNYSDSVVLKVKGSIQGNSTVTINFLVTNHNTPIVLSDENPTNNNSFLAYSIVPAGPLPVTFTGLTAVNKGCAVDVDFYTEREINVIKYEIEISKDGVSFAKTGELAAANLPHYQFNFAITEANRASVLFVRVKSVDKDGSLKYSVTKSVKGLCSNEWEVAAYPNPANSVSAITITARQGSFNGKYSVIVTDLAGRQMMVKQLNLTSVNKFNLETGNLSAGQYIINILNQEEGQSSSVKWIKN